MRKSGIFVSGLLFLLFLGSTAPTSATNFTVTKTTNSNDGTCDADCSLREAVAAADSGDTVLFDPSLFGTFGCDRQRLVERDMPRLDILINSWAPAREIHEDAAHELCGYTKKVGPILPARGFPVDQTQVGFINKCGGLEDVVFTFAAHVAPREAMQLSVNQRSEPFQRGFVSIAPRDQEVGESMRFGGVHSVLKEGADQTLLPPRRVLASRLSNSFGESGIVPHSHNLTQ